MLVQTSDAVAEDPSAFKVVTKREPTEAETERHECTERRRSQFRYAWLKSARGSVGRPRS